MNSLVEFWRQYPLEKPPFIHPEDSAALKLMKMERYFDYTNDSFETFVAGDRFGDFKNNKFFTALLPAPYMGRLDDADIIILMLNPGFQLVDYYAEYRKTGVKEIREKTLRQELDGLEFPFCWLNPEFCWHSGFVYWEAKLRGVLRKIADRYYHGRYLFALKALSRRLATIQLVPYHSSKFDADKLIGILPSACVTKRYVKTILEPGARNRKKTLIVMRKKSAWAINDGEPNIIVYDSNHALGARLEPTTRGGEAILNRFECSKPMGICS